MNESTRSVENEKRIDKCLARIREKFNVTKFEKLGKGGYGKVYQATIQNKRYAIKIIDCLELIDQAKPEDKETNKKMIDNECLFLLSLNHKNLLKGVSKMIFPEEKFMVILMVFCENLDLHFIYKLFYQKKLFKDVIIEEKVENNVKDNQKNYVNGDGMNNCLRCPQESFLRFFAVQILNGLKYLYECGLVHCDLKLRNILVSRNFTAKIADFGTMKSKKEHMVFPNISTKGFQAPEFALGIKDELNDENVHKYDLFSFGALIYTFITDSNYIDVEKFKKKKKMEYFQDIYQEKIVENDFFNQRPQLKSLLEGLLHYNITKRFNLQQTLEHEWFNFKNEENEGEQSQINYIYFSEMHDNDSIKLLLELQKIDYSNYLKEKLKINIFKGYEIKKNQKENEEFEIAPMTND